MKSLDKNQQDNIRWLSNSISMLTDSIDTLMNFCQLDDWSKNLANSAVYNIANAIQKINTIIKHSADNLEIELPFNEEN